MIKNLSIKKKLFILISIPIIFLVVISFKTILSEFAKVSSLNNLNDTIEMSTKVSRLIHETQKERGMTAGFLGSKGSKFSEQLSKQRLLTNTKLKELNNYLSTVNISGINQNIQKGIATALKSLKNIDDIRKNVDTLNISASKAIGFYTKANSKFLKIIIEVSKISKSPKITKQLVAYSNFLYAKEKAGIERAVGANTLANDKFQAGTRTKFNNLISQQNAFLDNFSQYSTIDASSYYKKTLSGNAVDEIGRIRKLVLNADELGGFNTDAQYWFDTITKKIKLLKKTENYIASNLSISNTSLKQEATLAVTITNLLHETQKERGATAGFLGSKGKKFVQTLPNQRKLTDERISLLKNKISEVTPLLNKRTSDSLNKALDKLSKIQDIRKEVSSLNIKASTAISYYTSMNGDFLQTVGNIARKATTSSETKTLSAFYNFVMSKERAGIERAVLSNSFARNKFLPGMKEKFIKLITEQASYLNSFNNLATLPMRKFYTNTLQGKAIEEVARMRQVALSSTTIGGFGVDPVYWFKMATQRINKLKQIDDYLAKELLSSISIALKAEKTDLFLVLLINVLGILGSIIFAIFITRNISSSLKNFQEGLLNFFKFLNKENPEVKLLNSSSNDEIGNMSKVVNTNIEKIQHGLKEDNELIENAEAVMARVANGWYSEHIQKNSSNPTLNLLKDNINSMIANTKSRFNQVNAILKKYSNYDYRDDLVIDDIEKGGVFEVLINDINVLKASITTMLITNKRNGLTLSSSSKKLFTNVNILNDSSNSAAASLEETAAALEQITGTIVNNTENITEMSSYANQVTTAAKKGEALASETMVSMDEINDKVTAINEAITVIDQIAFQTNILSLNAAVEAATAGEAGKGFAVVAQEVRNLAARSADAAKEIKDLVGNANERTITGKNTAENMLEGYNGLNQSIDKTLNLIQQVEAASNEQKLGIEQINDAINKLDHQTQQNANVAHETKDIALETQTIAETIVEDTDKKQFVGKDSVIDRRAGDRDKESGFTGKEQRSYNIKREALPKETPKHIDTPKPKESIPSTKIEAKEDDEEWESF